MKTVNKRFMKTTAKELNISEEKKIREGGINVSGLSKRNRTPNSIRMHAKLGEMDTGVYEREMEDITSGTDYPNIHLLRNLTKGSDFRGYMDWISFFMKTEQISERRAYERTEGIALMYFGQERFSSFASYDETKRSFYKKKSK